MSAPIRIALIHPGNAYLPEIHAYQNFLKPYGFQMDIFEVKHAHNLQNYAVEWHLMGIDLQPKVSNRLKIHEYISLSLPPLSKWKDVFKQKFNAIPDLRIFHTKSVKKELYFKKETPFLFRDAGIGAHFFQTGEIQNLQYDFVYLGTMNATRQMHLLFQHFLKNFHNQTLLVIGEAPVKLQQTFSSHQIHFAGKVPYLEVPNLLRQARFGLNYIPVCRPYYLQPSLKLLEYCAIGLPIITTDYEWVNHFENQRAARFFKIKPNWRNFNWDTISSFDFKTPDVQDLNWTNMLTNSGILPFLQSRL